MYKVILLILIFVDYLLADSYNFSEIRYSDAIGQSIEMKGKISFIENGLIIEYSNKKSLAYQNDMLVYKENLQIINLDDLQMEQIKSYFDLLILFHSGNKDALSNVFEVEDAQTTVLLKPKGTLQNYIIKVELHKFQKRLQNIKFFLQNNDNIIINIDNEIR